MNEENNILEVSKNELSWTIHPVKRKPFLSILVSIFISLVATIVYFIMESFGFGLLAMVVLFVSISKFYLPTTYRLTEDEIQIKTITQTMKKAWSLFRSYYPDKNGVLLSPFVEPSRLENFRGVYLIFDENRDIVLDFVKSQINREHAMIEPEPEETKE